MGRLRKIQDLEQFLKMLSKINKKADVSIVLLVFMALVLVGATLFIFNINLRKFRTEIINVKALDSVYIRENEINFYVGRMMDNSIEKDISKEQFIINFKEELERHKVDGAYVLEELSQVEDQISDIEITDTKVVFDLDIRVIKNFKEISITYVYNKKFEKEFEKDLI